jgi:hypothetical protein
VCDGAGRPLLSWRVLILPYVEEDDLYAKFYMDEPWDSPHNRELLGRMPKVYSLPTTDAEPSQTYIQAFHGKDASFEGSTGLRIGEDFLDHGSHTILLAEAGESVPWTKPADLEYDAALPLPLLGGVFKDKGRFSLFGPNRRVGYHVALVDCSIRFLEPGIDEATLRSAINRKDGTLAGRDW